MAIILNIDTAIDTASVCLAKDGKALQSAVNSHQRDHASWLHPTIQKIVAEAGLSLKNIDAVAVTIGPGSYTGLRVGLAAAKGLCYALTVPLIAINTLQMMAFAAKEEEADFICPMIDARRMEVFMAVYDKQMAAIIKPCALVVEPHSFDSLLAQGKILFLGNGSQKLKPVIVHPNVIFNNMAVVADDMTLLSESSFTKKSFVALENVEPFYIKEFYTPPLH